MKIRNSITGFIAAVCCLNSITAFGLERLFTTSAERAQLDAGRFQNEKTDLAAPPEAPESLTVDGVVLRRNSRNQIWVNGSSSNLADRAAGYSAKQTRAKYNSVPIHLIGKSADIILRPGETYFVQSGIKKDAYEWQPEVPVLDDAAAVVSEENADTPAEALTENSKRPMKSR